MLLLEWSSEYSVGVKKFDDQHKRMFDIINHFYALMTVDREHDKIQNTLQELKDYANYHLADEEKYFEKFNYPKKEEHKKIHDEYRKKINEFIKERDNKDGRLMSFDIIDYLEDWWIGHIMGMDKEYVDFFKDKKID
ncbi:hypothetical protein A2331_01320 [Candidatus Falkowbacteria bacterium RIFOXYB2_FULL_34_18]|uniref:Hemerythrin-like domain-containing protein n=1 Tax=Candidatus Falkowbacteria bacterium RIFOXYD2_FULL_34_120 TaxID=1798007 RepID=A0A1F5TQR6_9BACT|nr:MAG: hypothetical protein A2331_01320 [Candidatus Falkowbacteria bacterium RIFOXYB2_FULL_34_18]OGF29257.1 MAG: hypothetical protein A2500_05200 [Candidatus Falkowbacteria bacterium RIFOXYC12_FULL_34_55]OGF36373.1 MAG: hypothetical protein A2466_00860 [Candidatus Falkowbacteria bacterium RIFOXYC2_FULL_34_220]OGF38852.1 MAG: hypothetical protein A2515_05620 [Candidatus Falkowbacteria bacterium RIFOXYD12_FULL_34_57]OGF40871.1 MAG: hypothetical protein A2531_03845 [Candidatus Falkowbacteria bact